MSRGEIRADIRRRGKRERKERGEKREAVHPLRSTANENDVFVPSGGTQRGGAGTKVSGRRKRAVSIAIVVE